MQSANPYINFYNGGPLELPAAASVRDDLLYGVGGEFEGSANFTGSVSTAILAPGFLGFHGLYAPAPSDTASGVDNGLGELGTAQPVDTGECESGGTYTNRDLLNYMFGRQTIQSWSDLENENEETEIIACRIANEILNVEAFIDAHLCHLYSTPFDPVPRQIQTIATALVGHNLRDARHMEEDEATVLRKYDRAMNDLMLIKECAIRLPGLLASTMAGN